MSIRTFFDDLLKDLARGGGSIVPAEAVTPAPAPSTTPAGDDAGGDIDADSVRGADDAPTPAPTPEPGTPATGRLSDPGVDATTPADADDDGGQGLDDDGGQGLDDDGADDADDTPPALDAEKLARRLHAALVAADGRLADPGAVPFDADHLDDAAALTAAIDAVVRDNPAARARRYGGDIGAGNRGAAPRPPVDLIQLMKKG